MSNNTNGFHSSSSSMSASGINDNAKRLPSTTAVNKRLKSKNVVLITVNETRSIKGMNKKQKPIDLKKKNLIHSDSNNNNNSTKKVKQHTLEHNSSTSSNKKETYHIINNDYCHSCGEMISCNTCQSTFHICDNLPLSKEDLPKNSYFCDNCRSITKTQEELINKDKQQKLILPFRFDPKKTLHINGLKKNHQHRSTLEQTKLPTASNGRSLIQPSGEIKFRATSTHKIKHLPSSNLKRKRTDSSSSINIPIVNPIKIANTQLDVLHRLLLSCQSEEFHGPSNDSTYYTEKYCFICRKSSIKQGPSIHCDYCPLTYHLDCLTPPMTSLPLSNEKWMCPNHIEPRLDRYLTKKQEFSTTQRVKIYHQHSQIEQNSILQEFTSRKQTKDNLLSNTINNHRLERIDISQIPKGIEEFYLKANIEQKQICGIEPIDHKEEYVQTTFPPNESSSAYDPCIWDILQEILNHIVHDHSYQFSSIEPLSIENDHFLTESSSSKNQFNTLDILLQALNEPNYPSEQCTINQTNGFDTLLAASLCDEKQNSTSLINPLSLLIDLTQFHLSHAALIHLRSQHVIYIRKHVIWFGSSPLNDIYLGDFNHSRTCQYISERHACLYYDRKHNLFELLNYSEYGTIVNDLHYGLDILTNDDNKNENLQKCFCLIKPSYQAAWDGPAQIEQGTVIKIGCHEFLFYRHIVR